MNKPQWEAVETRRAAAARAPFATVLWRDQEFGVCGVCVRVRKGGCVIAVI